MTAIATYEGDKVFATLLATGTSADRPSSSGLLIGLFTVNLAVNTGTTYTGSGATSLSTSGNTPALTGGYAEQAIANGSWSISSSGVMTSTAVVFTASASWTYAIAGYYIRTTGGTTSRIVAIEVDPSGSWTMTPGSTYTVTPQITFA